MHAASKLSFCTQCRLLKLVL